MASRSDKEDRRELSTVLITSDMAKIAIAKSLLEAAGIPCFAKGEQIQSLFGLGVLVAVNPITGPVQIQVAACDLDRSLEALSELLEEEIGDDS